MKEATTKLTWETPEIVDLDLNKTESGGIPGFSESTPLTGGS